MTKDNIEKITDLNELVTAALKIAVDVDAHAVAVRIEQARLLLINPPTSKEGLSGKGYET